MVRQAMLSILLLAATPILASCTTAGLRPEERMNGATPELEGERQPAPPLPDLGPAPELTNEVWLNTSEPLRLAALGGKVVLLEFWTFG